MNHEDTKEIKKIKSLFLVLSWLSLLYFRRAPQQ